MSRFAVRLSFVAAALAVALSAASAVAQAPPAGSPVARHGQLSVSGNRVVNSSGDPVQLRGMSFYWSMGRTTKAFYNADAVKWLADDWKVDAVRAAMGVEANWAGDEQGYLSDPTNKARVEAVVQGAIGAGVYVLIDWHSHAAENHADAAVNFFKEMANKYKGVPNVIYEIYNEPTQTQVAAWRNNLLPYMQRVTDTIRAADPLNLIIIGTPQWCQRPDIAADYPVAGENLVYSAHFYAGTTDPDHEASHKRVLRSRIVYTLNKGFPVFVSEFGSCNFDGKGSHDMQETDRWLAFLDQFQIGWANWSITTIGEAASALTSGASSTGNWSASQLTASGTYIRGKLRSSPGTEKQFFTLTVSIDGKGNVGRSPSFHIYDRGTAVELSPTPFGGWSFGGWGGDLTGNASPRTVTMDRDMVITATFTDDNATTAVSRAAAAPARWSVRQTAAGLVLQGPAPADVVFYDMRGKRVGKFLYGGHGGGSMVVSKLAAPAGNYIMIVRDKTTGRRTIKTKVMIMP